MLRVRLQCSDSLLVMCWHLIDNSAIISFQDSQAAFTVAQN